MQTLANLATNTTTQAIQSRFNALVTSKGNSTQQQTLLSLFNVVIFTDINLFPNLSKSITTIDEYLNKWMDNYIKADNNPPSTKTSNPKTACTDPVISTIVQSHPIIQAVLTSSPTTQYFNLEEIYNLMKDAQNVQGNLLEEYIDSIISNYGWIWCKGNTVNKVDFINSNGSYLLQVKNKHNTENSSSSTVRNGTNIEKWYRLDSRKNGNIYIPVTRWDDLNTIINTKSNGIGNGVQCNMNDVDYDRFINNVVSNNPQLVNEN